MKNITHVSTLFLKTVLAGFFVLFALQGATAQHRYPNHFRTGVGFAYILDGDNSGALFSQQYTRELTDHLHFSVSGEYLSSSRYSKEISLFTSRKAFVMFDASFFYDLYETPKYTIKLGAGPAVRRRSELDLVRGGVEEGAVITPGRNDDEVFVHIREKDFGGKVVLETDFFNDNRLFFGMRAAGYIYNKGTSIFAAQLNMGYSF
ncbi:hypothetical protein ACD591_07895 [Rufibacter glacialis]|uniref:Uncharacterized protein n=1 Tax=Rufibacter glacialis TaxID=1259555 RepID=A0A5M8QGP6_9BACT|nr:hypothetical protein [Rufibacter glacialis]KAA6433552.1 hypothetical protein FOE74_13920 [Rufibacter glacialis]GGK73130.1 hypothetical protein GCM10011405_21550 [Rufibacter glacialis]